MKLIRMMAKDPKFTPEAVEAFRAHSNPIIYPDTDWMELLFKSSAPQTQGNVEYIGRYGEGSILHFDGYAGSERFL